MNNDAKSMRERLAAPFADAEIEWRLQWHDDEKGTGIAVPYVTNRAIQNRLDDCAGIDGWKNEFLPWHGDGGKKPAQLCGISVRFGEGGEWISKYDGADDSDMESVKGGLSDAMKRAAVQWGVGRYLYGMDTVFTETEKRGKTAFIKKTERAKLDKAHRDHAARFFKKDARRPETPEANPGAGPQEPAPIAKAPAKAPKSKEAETEAAYTVVKTVLQASAKGGNNTSLQLETGDGGFIQAFARGENPEFKPGARLTDVKMSEKLSGGVRFLILDGYRIMKDAA
jgi:hypothetical protein